MRGRSPSAAVGSDHTCPARVATASLALASLLGMVGPGCVDSPPPRAVSRADAVATGVDGALPLDLGSPDRDAGAEQVDIPRGDAAGDLSGSGDLGGCAAPASLEFGAHCCVDADCRSGWCIDTDELGQVCSRPCNDDCPPGWDCKPLSASGGDVTFLCIPSSVLCRPCQRAEQCGDPANLCLAIGDGTFCARACSGDTDCPAGYGCRAASEGGGPADQRQCLPDSGWCTPCRDEDEDGHRGGPDCEEATDCDDGDPLVYRGAAERCNAVDDDCDGEIDEGFSLSSDPDHCGGCGQQCRLPDAQPGCVAGSCILVSCGAGQPCAAGYACQGGFCCTAGHWHLSGLEADGCEYACTVTRDGVESCDEQDNDCDGQTDEDTDLLHDPDNCGSCGTVCPLARCSAQQEGYAQQGDSICELGSCSQPELVSCGLYTCVDGGDAGNRCAVRCQDDAFCVASAHCEDGLCVADRPDGASCVEDRECASGHCGNGFCCLAGDCCSQAEDCPPGYATPARCTFPTACQGSRADAACNEEHRCVAQPIDDDTACHGEVVADECGLYRAVHCNGEPEQADPPCPAACTADAECDPGAHCDGTCQPDLPDGTACDEDSDCLSRHCGNGFCCAEGDCCATAASCPARYVVLPHCDDLSSCQGHRQDATCIEHRCGTSEPIADDRGCALGAISDECGYYPAARCTGEEVQLDPPCPASCLFDADCDPQAHCDAGQCVADLDAGSPCDEPSDCRAGLSCVDGVCCTTPCNGLCQRCDLSGDGSCTNVPAGFDPDGECGGLGCAGWFWGWEGKSCHARANAAEGAVSCNGNGACQTAAAVCPLQGKGPVAGSCDATCQQTAAGSCSGTTGPSCTNLDLGAQTCGTGACQRTTPRCVNGAPNSCVPGNPVGESCNDLDDDCNGTVDDNVPGAADAFEPSAACLAPRDLGTVAEDSSEQSWGATIYPAGDQDYYRINAEEGVHTCFPFTGQDYALRVRLVPPQGDDCVDFDLYLYDDGCNLLGSSRAAGCNAESITVEWGGTCIANDSRYFRIEVRGWGASGWECVGYTLYADMWQL